MTKHHSFNMFVPFPKATEPDAIKEEFAVVIQTELVKRGVWLGNKFTIGYTPLKDCYKILVCWSENV